MKSIAAILPFFIDSAEAGCSDVPSGLIPNGNGESFPFSLFETQRLGFHQCDGPLTDGEFAEGTRCQKISCFGPNNHINHSEGAICKCAEEGACNWMKESNPQESAIPNCPKGCLASPAFELNRCRKHYMGGDASYKDVSGETYYWPGQRCKRVQCSEMRRPKKPNRFDTMKFWRLVAKDFFECVCHPDDSLCVWSELTDSAVTAFNEGVELECAEWSEWRNTGKCRKGKQNRKRDCLISQVSYEYRGSEGESKKIRGEAGVDCEGEASDQIDC